MTLSAMHPVVCCAQEAPADQQSPTICEIILSRYQTILLEQPIEEVSRVPGYIANLSNDGAWPDLNYRDRRFFGWEPQEHLHRIEAMSYAWSKKEHPLYNNSELRSAINRALDNWLVNRYQGRNWWHNQIGVPKSIRNTIVLLGDNLRGDRRKGAMEVLAQHGTGGTGANLTWQTELVFHEACLQGASEKLSAPVDRLLKEVQVGDKEGIQDDWTFYQHGKRQQSFSYGRSYIDIIVDLGWQLRGTPLEIPKEKQAIVTGFLLDGLQWMSRGTYTPPSTIDRAISRKHAPTYSDLRNTLRRWIDVTPDRKAEFQDFLAHQKGGERRQLGHRHFPKGEFTTYHRPTGSIFLKTISTRTKSTELMGGENKKGTPYLHSGDYYIVRDGSEYALAPPVWKWNQLPGLTTSSRSSQQVHKDFVGGVSNGKSGLSVMHYLRTTDSKLAVRTRKAWFFYGDLMINLFSDLESGADDPSLVTSMEQCQLQGPVEVSQGQRQHQILPAGKHLIENTQWVMHRQIGYFPLEPSQMTLSIGPATGSWSSINSRYKDQRNSVSLPVFFLQRPHLTGKPAGGHVVMLDATKEKLDEITQSPTWQVLRNDRQCQAIRFDGGLTMAAFYQPGKVGKEGRSLEVSHSCLAMWDDDTLWLCDPTNIGMTIDVRLESEQHTLTLLPEGVTLKIPRTIRTIGKSTDSTVPR